MSNLKAKEYKTFESIKPKTATKQVVDFKLTRYACCLIVQNGDPRKEEKLVRIDKSRLAFECEKLNQVDEQKMAEEGIGSEVM